MMKNLIIQLVFKFNLLKVKVNASQNKFMYIHTGHGGQMTHKFKLAMTDPLGL